MRNASSHDLSLDIPKSVYKWTFTLQLSAVAYGVIVAIQTSIASVFSFIMKEF
jgi:hypothetical protein